ncbi:hypothetical protein Bca4012_089099 [Brassica carinata]
MKRGFLGPSKKESAGLCMIRKSTREVPIDTLQAAAIDSVHHQSIDTRQTMKNDTTCGETEKVEVLILKVDENGMLRDKEGRTRNSA